ncbi:hypothetical protein ACTXT7_009781 [Hymenolepis weldensis]
MARFDFYLTNGHTELPVRLPYWSNLRAACASIWSSKNHGLGSSAATSCDAMDIDSSSLAPESTSEQASLHIPQLQPQQLVNKSHILVNGNDALSSAKMTTCNFPDDEDDDETDDLDQPVPMDIGSLTSLYANACLCVDKASLLATDDSGLATVLVVHTLQICHLLEFESSVVASAYGHKGKKISIALLITTAVSVCFALIKYGLDPDKNGAPPITERFTNGNLNIKRPIKKGNSLLVPSWIFSPYEHLKELVFSSWAIPSNCVLPGGAAPQQQQVPSAAGSSASLNALSVGDGDRDYLMRQIRFSRSLMDLAKDVEMKKGTISPETDRLLHDSVCLLAYEKPSDPECPLRCLFDSSGRDNIASLINSAILSVCFDLVWQNYEPSPNTLIAYNSQCRELYFRLSYFINFIESLAAEEHKLPAQPNIEKILYKLERYLTSTDESQAQSLAHFLLYHLTPSQYQEEMNRLVKSTTEPRILSDPPSGNNGTTNKNSNSKADESFQSIEHPRGTTRRNRRLNHAVVSNGTSNGRVSPPKRRSNGARRRYWRRQIPVGSTEDDDENEEEEEVGDFSLEDEGEGVQLHRHEELEDDSEMNIEGGDGEDGESLEDEEEEVELMTASMEEDGFEDSQEGEEQEEEDEIAYDPGDVEGIPHEGEEEEDMIQFAGWNNERWNRLSSGRSQDEVGVSNRGGDRASASHQGSEGPSTEPFLSFMSRSPRYGRNTIVEGNPATDNFWPRVNPLYTSRNPRRGQQPPPSSNGDDDATNNADQ